MNNAISKLLDVDVVLKVHFIGTLILGEFKDSFANRLYCFLTHISRCILPLVGWKLLELFGSTGVALMAENCCWLTWGTLGSGVLLVVVGSSNITGFGEATIFFVVFVICPCCFGLGFLYQVSFHSGCIGFLDGWHRLVAGADHFIFFGNCGHVSVVSCVV